MLVGGSVAKYHERADKWLAKGRKGHLQRSSLPNNDYREPKLGFSISTFEANLRKCWIRSRLNELWVPPLSDTARFEDIYRQVLDEAAAIAKARPSPLTSDDVAGPDAENSTDCDESEDGDGGED